MAAVSQQMLILALLVHAGSALKGKTELSATLSSSGRAQELSLERAWAKELADQNPVGTPEGTTVVKKKSPIQRVVGLLTEMKTQLENEAKNDEEIYDKMVCWCETSEKEKTKAIADAEAKDKDLTAEIEERAARHGVLETEIGATKDLIAETKNALDEALGLREKEQGEFMSEEKEMVQALMNLKNAIAVLSKHHGGSFAQLDAKVVLSMDTVLRDVAVKHEEMLGDSDAADKTRKKLKVALLSISSEDRAQEGATLRGLRVALDAFSEGEGRTGVLKPEWAERVLAHAAKEASLETPGGASFVQEKAGQPAGAGESYAPASGAIFGILKQLKEDFETNLAGSQKDETKAQDDYAELKMSKEELLKTSEAKLEEMQQELAANKKALFDAKEDLELTRKQRTADVEFLRNLKLTCNDLDKQMEQRSKARTEEIKAVAEALAIITEDDNADMLRKTVTLLQENSESQMERAMRSHAATLLRNKAQQPDFDDLVNAWDSRHAGSIVENPRAKLMTLAVAVQLDAFTKVKEVMDKMIAELKDQQLEEVKLKEFCTTEFNKNEQQIFTKTDEKEDLEIKIEQLTALMEQLTKEIEEAKQQIADTQLAIKKASEDREKENAQFQTTVAEQRATQTILKKALEKLTAFYKKKSLLQAQAGQAPPVQFTPMKKNAGASPVIGMIEQIIEESVAVEKEAVATETEAQTDYEKMVKDSNDLIEQLNNGITQKTADKAQAEMDKTQAIADKDAAIAELESLASYKADLHEQCDFVLKNFDIRQKARLQEIEAIQEAKAILSGAKFIQK